MTIAADKYPIAANAFADSVKPKSLAHRKESRNLNRLRLEIKLLIGQIFV